jgi:hypothetical protein
MSGGMVRQTWALGYPGLQALKQADPEEYHVKCRRYYSEAFKGKPFDQTLDTAQGHISRMKQAVAIVEE